MQATVKCRGMSFAVANVAQGALIHDEESGLGYDRHRYTQPGLGRMMTRERSGGLYIDGMNLYQYELSNPLVFVDPSGDSSVGWVPGKGYPCSSGDPGAVWMGDGYYSSTPPLGSPWAGNPNLTQQCMNNANNGPRKPCNQCWIDYYAAQKRILSQFHPIGSGILGAGPGIIVGGIIKGGAIGMGAVTEEWYWGPAGWVAGGVGAVGGLGIGLYQGEQTYKDQQQQSKWAWEDLQRCLLNCDPGKG
jgi:RHS repeat-associated protein